MSTSVGDVLILLYLLGCLGYTRHAKGTVGTLILRISAAFREHILCR